MTPDAGVGAPYEQMLIGDNTYNVASTKLELKPHTDMRSCNSLLGVQMFHFLVNDSVAGESTAVDGAQAAKKLKHQAPEAH